MEPTISTGGIILAAIGLLASVITASLSYVFAKSREIAMKNRQLKEEHYREFMRAMSDVALDNKSHAALDRFADSMNTITLVGGGPVVHAVMELHDWIREGNTSVERNSEEWVKRHDDLLNDVVKSMRMDLYGKHPNPNKHFPRIHLVGSGRGKNK